MFTMQLRGGAELIRALSLLPAKVSRKVQLDILRNAAEPMRTRMSSLAPFEPGKPDLRDTMTISNIRTESAKDDLHLTETAVAVGPTKAGFYGSFLEFGTSRMHARPFMRPAFDGVAPQSLGIIQMLIWDALRKTTAASPSTTGGRFT